MCFFRLTGLESERLDPLSIDLAVSKFLEEGRIRLIDENSIRITSW